VVQHAEHSLDRPGEALGRLEDAAAELVAHTHDALEALAREVGRRLSEALLVERAKDSVPIEGRRRRERIRVNAGELRQSILAHGGVIGRRLVRSLILDLEVATCLFERVCAESRKSGVAIKCCARTGSVKL